MSEIVPPEFEPAPEPDLATEVVIEQMEESFETSGPLVLIVAGTDDDLARMAAATEYLSAQGIEYETRVMILPGMVGTYCEGARAAGLKVIIVGAAMATALPGIAAAHTDLPVIGVPFTGEGVEGSDAMLATAQVPAASPVACVAIDGAENAAVLAARIINA